MFPCLHDSHRGISHPLTLQMKYGIALVSFFDRDYTPTWRQLTMKNVNQRVKLRRQIDRLR